jgi:predicted N-acyltransferase
MMTVLDTLLYIYAFLLLLPYTAWGFSDVKPCKIRSNCNRPFTYRRGNERIIPFPTFSSTTRRHIGVVAGTSSSSDKETNNSPTKKSTNAPLNGKSKAMEPTIEFIFHRSIGSIPPEAWDACRAADGTLSPFMEHTWLRCLEESKCASPQTGWGPQHVAIHIDGQAKGFVPVYIKGNSLGEFIFDQGWAEAAYENGIPYYPKLLVAVPFTPATGQRILWHPSVYRDYSAEEIAQFRRQVFQFLRQIAQRNRLSSVHGNFLTNDEAMDIVGPLRPVNSKPSPQDLVQSLLQQLQSNDDYVRRTSIQYHWTNSNPKNDGKPYTSFDDYLNCFKSKKRINIKRERRKVLEDENIVIEAIRGKDILKVPGLMDRMFEIYLHTIEKLYWGRQYLTLEFFQMIGNSTFVDNLVFMCARHANSSDTLQAEDVFAGTFSTYT